MNIPDNTKFENMVRNRPPLSILPAINKRILSQSLARSIFAVSAFGIASTIFVYKLFINANSAPFLKTRKAFSFEVDPYSGKVNCNYRDVPNYQHGY
jgi:hypothetical protein